ncbi:MAG TPA: DcrB-related protein [Polyangiaceae bacterium]|jgi:hypothetical protein|nr:DcrB-related protein [Polyangiaceae bacterium]
MAAYFMNEGVFELPELGFQDKTVQFFSAPLGAGRELGLIVCRTKIPDGSTLDAEVQSHVQHEAKTLRAFAVLDQKWVEHAGARGIEVSSRYRVGTEMTYQRQTHLAVWDLWLFFGVTGPMAERERADACLADVLGTFRLRSS